VKILGWVISPFSRPLSAQDKTHSEKCGQTSMPPVGLESTITIFGKAKICLALESAVIVFYIVILKLFLTETKIILQENISNLLQGNASEFNYRTTGWEEV
jgi:hypothetical protein